MANVLGCVEDWANQQPDKPLYVFLSAQGQPVESLTYAEFLERVGVVAGHLSLDPRLAPGDRLLLAYPSGLEMICAFFACVRAGLIPTPVPALAAQGGEAMLLRMAHVARDCQAAGVLTTREGLDRLAAQADEETAPALLGLAWIDTTALTAPASADGRRPASELLFLQYTSGSTNDPKGVMVSHANILANAGLVLDHGAPVTVSWLPQHHDMGLIGYYLNTAIGGGTLYGFSATSFIQRPSLWLDTISRYRATASSAPNFAFEHCMRPGRISQEILDTLDLGSLRMLMAAAEPIKPSVYRSFLQTFQRYGLKPESFNVAYGLAENTLAVSSYGRQILSLSKTALSHGEVKPTQEVSEVAGAIHIMSCGHALGDNDVRIVDPETLLPAPCGEVGEIWVSGASKCKGYWGHPEATRDTFEARIAGEACGRDYLRTGDMGFLRDGELYVCGRRKDMLIVRGQNYYPQDIEILVEQVAGVRRSGVAAVEASADAEIVILAEAAGSRTVPNPQEIANRVRSRLNLEVGRVVVVPPRSLPKTSSGKLMRARSRQMWEGGDFQTLDSFARAAASDAEALLSADEAPFGFFKAKYRLSGTETHSLTDAGLDSLDLVLLLHEFSELLAKKGARELAEQVDIRLVQQMSIAELFRLAARFDEAPETAVAQVRRSLNNLDQARRSEEHAMMAADRTLSFKPDGVAPGAEVYPPRTLLLTGATGFLGPFLLTSLLSQTQAKIYALVRGTSPEHAATRLRAAVADTSKRDDAFWRAFDRRVVAICGDLDEPGLGLAPEQWETLSRDVDTIYHNGAMVNYLFSYKRMRAANVVGTNEVLKLAFAGRRKVFNYVSTTFIYGWATKDVLYESDANDGMELLDFGYSQSKWTAEQVVSDAKRRGLTTRIFRPALVTPAVNGDGANFDITLRLLAFMIKYGIGVDALNQVSFMPADVTADNIVAISNLPQTAQGTFHVTRDDYANMIDITAIITRLTGRQFEPFDLPSFVPEVIKRCTREDFLFPLLDFLVGSIDNISSMEFKRYDSSGYQRARAASPCGRPDPSLSDTVAGMLRFMQRTGMIELPATLLAEQDAA